MNATRKIVRNWNYTTAFDDFRAPKQLPPRSRECCCQFRLNNNSTRLDLRKERGGCGQKHLGVTRLYIRRARRWLGGALEISAALAHVTAEFRRDRRPAVPYVTRRGNRSGPTPKRARYITPESPRIRAAFEPPRVRRRLRDVRSSPRDGGNADHYLNFLLRSDVSTRRTPVPNWHWLYICDGEMKSLARRLILSDRGGRARRSQSRRRTNERFEQFQVPRRGICTHRRYVLRHANAKFRFVSKTGAVPSDKALIDGHV